ncbi:Uncharacterized protein APZ42_025213 [Daphnia magna]|uniref:Uncharacterized protein n=1 Tax=Daphnia magna TaxID=35525 RepID=A0A162DDN4_9CRUS|nr:Uncharacterized protein APZ42_025213 [Daphnia magna]
MRIKAVNDTEVVVSVASLNLQETLEACRMGWDGPSVVMVNGQRFPPLGVLELEIEHRGMKASGKVIVLEMKWIELLLSNEFLIQFKRLQINYVPTGAELLLGELPVNAQVASTLPPADVEKLVELLEEFDTSFALKERELGVCKIAEHRINTGTATPVHQSPYKSAWKERAIVQKQVDEIVDRNGRFASLKIRLVKCQFGASKVKALGHVISGDGVRPDPEKIKAVANFPSPSTLCKPSEQLKCVRSFVVLCSYYRRFIPQFADTAKPLTDMFKKGGCFVWKESQEVSFGLMKQAIVSAAFLAYPEMHPDACDYGLGAVLKLRVNNIERPLAYASRLLSLSESNYSITEKECLALVWAVKKFRSYIWGMNTLVVTDHHALCWLLTKKDLAGRLARWSLQLQEFLLRIIHRNGRLHTDADAFSRYPVDAPQEFDDQLQCTLAAFSVDTDSESEFQQAQQVEWDQVFAGLEKGKKYSQHGAPRQLATEQGRCFTAEITKKVLEAVRQRLTVPQGNANMKARDGLHSIWCTEEKLFSPTMAPSMRIRVWYLHLTGIRPSGWVERLQQARLEVQARAAAVQQRQKKIYDEGRRETTTYLPGEELGPYTVVRQTTPSNYELRLGRTVKTEIVHVERMKPFVDCDSILTPEREADVGSSSGVPGPELRGVNRNTPADTPAARDGPSHGPGPVAASEIVAYQGVIFKSEGELAFSDSEWVVVKDFTFDPVDQVIKSLYEWLDIRMNAMTDHYTEPKSQFKQALQQHVKKRTQKELLKLLTKISHRCSRVQSETWPSGWRRSSS